ncbi:MAG TPA: hypothetical protein VIU45_00695 [Chitinophagaceae bacterium]
MSVFIFIMMILAGWRITHLLAKEEGPFDITLWLREKAGAGFFGSLLDCFYCVSVWVALPLGIWYGSSWWEKLLCWFAFSGAICLLEQATTRQEKEEDDMPDFKED